MTLRTRAMLVYGAICAASAVLCAVNHAPWLAAVEGIAAIAVWRVRFAQPLASPDVDALIARLRDARTAEEARPAMIRATVTANVIAVPMRSSRRQRWRRTAIAFRDEMTEIQWRQVTTALRHQPRPVLSQALSAKIRIA